ncbi:MAG: hypothetical protein GF403_11040, partial [Candidatus Coatesbacteria bacterium]|nr:hypothetical protein [Candidatus Coatesbacteria bacterium]
MHKALTVMIILAIVAVPTLADNGLNAVQSTSYDEFYWDDGVMDSGWCWTSGSGYYAVEFDDTLTGGDAGQVNAMGAYVYPNWPDSTYVGAYLHLCDDGDGEPGTIIATEFLDPTTSGLNWVDGFEHSVPTGTFYIVWEQWGNYPTDNPDALAMDADGGSHSMIFDDSWSGANGDFMIRCYWESADSAQVEDTTWGEVKGLY